MSKVCEIKEYIKKLPVPLEAMEFLNTIHNNIFKELEESRHFYKWDKVLWESKQPTKLNNGRKLIGEINRRYGSVVAQISRTIYPSKPNVRVDVTPLVETYSVPKEENLSNKSPITEYERRTSNLVKELRREFLSNNGERGDNRVQSFIPSQTEIPFNVSKADSSEQNSLSKTNGEKSNSSLFAMETRESLLHIIQQKLSDTTTFNGRLYSKLRSVAPSTSLKTIDKGHMIYVSKYSLNVNLDGLLEHLKEIENPDYFDTLLSEELIHILTNVLISNKKGKEYAEEQIKLFPEFIKTVAEMYPTESSIEAYYEYVRMMVQRDVLGKSTMDDRGMATTPMFLEIMKEIWEFILSIVQTPNTRKLIQEHIDFINNEIKDTTPSIIPLNLNIKSNQQLKLALTNEIQEYETPAGINIGETTGLLWGNFAYSERKGIFNQSETPASYVRGSSFNDSLQDRISGKSFTEVWDSNEFSDSEKTTVLVHSIQQRLHNRDSFNGRLFDKINKQLGMLDIRILNSSNLPHPAFNFDKQIYVNPEALFNDFKANIPGDRVDGYLDLVLAEELIHVVTNYMLTPETRAAIARELSVSTYTRLQSIYQGIQPGDSQLAIMEYIRMIVQDEFLNTTSEQFRFPKAYSLGSFLADVWRFIMDAFKQNSGNLKQIVEQHISFIEEQSSIENLANSSELITPVLTIDNMNFNLPCL